MKKTMIVEPLAGGHRDHFLGLLIEELIRNPNRATEVVFVVSESSLLEYPDWLIVDRVPDGQIERLSGWRKKLAMGRLLRQAVTHHRPDEVLLLELTQFEWSLLWIRLPARLSAIVFVQPPFIPSILKRKFKIIKTRLLLKRNVWTSLFFLNGEAAVCEMKARIPGAHSVFKALPDPVADWEVLRPVSIAVEPSHSTALYFGAISRRKGFSVLVDAITRLPEAAAGKLELLICGKPEDPEYCEQECLRLKQHAKQIRLQIETRYLQEEEVCGYFQACDWVLMPYARPEYSSGILGLAAQAGKPVLGPEDGLLGDLIRTYELGSFCKIRAGALSRAIEQAVTGGLHFNPEKARKYVQKNSSVAFAKTLLGGAVA